MLNQIYALDREALKACIGFLQKQYPTLSEKQSERLIFLIFEPNFKYHLPNHFGKCDNGGWFGFPFIWMLNELETGGIRYEYRNEIWQIHWDVSDRYLGNVEHKKTINYLLTSGPSGEEGEQLFNKIGLVFFSYSIPWRFNWQYPFPEDADLSCPMEFCSSLKLRDFSRNPIRRDTTL